MQGALETIACLAAALLALPWVFSYGSLYIEWVVDFVNREKKR